MEHERAFLEAIQEQPDDDLHRLAWADWLDDHGQTDRAPSSARNCASPPCPRKT